MFQRKRRALDKLLKGKAAINKANTKMKKIIFVCIFALSAMVASATIEKGMSKNTSNITITEKVVNNSIVWDVTITCPSGATYYSCCYSSYNSAYYGGWAIYFEVC